jgi:ATPase subunit of ABC transporter with duplicated ATPase domains
MTARRPSGSTPAPAWSISTRPCASCPSTTACWTEGVTERDAIRSLAQAGFAFARIREPILLLSHGERSRLMFLKLKMMLPNLYLLDEPTSHLDIEGQEDLEAQLEDAEVACLFVSHDRWFTKAAATRFVEIRKGRLVEVESPDAFFAAQQG